MWHSVLEATADSEICGMDDTYKSAGKDFGYRIFWLSLVNQRNELEDLLARLEGCPYDLVLESQNAAWVRDRQSQKLAESAGTTTNQIPASRRAPILHLLKRRLAHQLARSQRSHIFWNKVLRWRVANYMLPISSHFYEERKHIAWAYMCRAIYTDPTLMLLALNYADVPSLLDDLNHDISTLRKLQQQMRSLPVTEIRAASDDVLGPHDEKAEYVTVLRARYSGLQDPSDFDCMHLSFSMALMFNGDNDERYIVEDLLVLRKVVYDCETVLEPCHAIAKPYIEDGELEPDSAGSREEYSLLH
ncbi:hypothetical protein DFH08DRAFT_805263 [Mycena albidolilacea]|uniref:Uncharacterized protein n=1 Tax=Mycena albidolilacea TaxID=1033008 RepID=A0AAD7A887_9AGAR|nr:hypothetical protein DFH08DRAFT_805263 [Mycena albidolilacea]